MTCGIVGPGRYFMFDVSSESYIIPGFPERINSRQAASTSDAFYFPLPILYQYGRSMGKISWSFGLRGWGLGTNISIEFGKPKIMSTKCRVLLSEHLCSHLIFGIRPPTTLGM
jgi:hypothetical protein